MNTIVRFESKIEETAECFGFLSEMKLKFECGVSLWVHERRFKKETVLDINGRS